MRPTDARRLALLTIVLLTVGLASRAATFGPHPRGIAVTSTHEGARVLVDGTLVGTTPPPSNSTGAPTASSSFASTDGSTSPRSGAASVAPTSPSTCCPARS